jgi:flagellar motor switch/type III secretory pathway protein FliN
VTEIRGLKGLKRHDPAASAFPLAMLRLLTAQLITADGAIHVGLIDSAAQQSLAFEAANGIEFSVANLAGLSTIANATDIDGACDALDNADALLTRIERALTISLAPSGLSPASQRSQASGDFAAFEISDQQHKIFLVIPRNHENADAWIASANQLVPPLHELPVLVRLSLSGPRLPLAEASDIEGGDLLLLPNRLAASLQTLGIDDSAGVGQGLTGVFDLRDGLFSNGDALENNFIGDNMHADDEFKNAEQFGALQVPVTIRLPEKLVQAADIAGLKPGGTLRLGAMVQGLVAELVIGGKILATGEIVQIGSDFALLIDERNPITAHNGATAGSSETGETEHSGDDQFYADEGEE